MAKRRYFVDVEKAIKFLAQAYGLTAFEVNYYHVKIRNSEFKGTFNWYHTQGTVTVEAENYSANVGEAGTDEDVALLINNYINKKVYGNTRTHNR